MQDLAALWMPFTANRQFKKSPRLLARAEGMHYWTPEGRRVLDGTAGLWCVNAGHCRAEIVAAIAAQAAELDFAPPFQMGHPQAFALAQRLARLAPGHPHVFFTNSGSEAVDTALKIALACHHARGDPGRHRLIGRARGYHGVNFGGTSVGGIGPNRRAFGPGVAGVDHLCHTHDPARNAFSRGQPVHGAELADDLERLCALHDPATVAAVIVEPVACSTGVLVAPHGYLERLRSICDKHGILLIFDEVITGFGRLGAAFASSLLGVAPDLFTTAKGLTNGAAPMGAVFASEAVHAALMRGPESAIELYHGYTYSGHPLACAAGLASLDVYEREGLFTRAGQIADHWESALHGLRGLPHVVDLRNMGLIGAIELAPRAHAPGQRAYDAFVRCFERGLLIRVTGDTIALSPPLIVSPAQIDEMFGMIAETLRSLD